MEKHSRVVCSFWQTGRVRNQTGRTRKQTGMLLKRGALLLMVVADCFLAALLLQSGESALTQQNMESSGKGAVTQQDMEQSGEARKAAADGMTETTASDDVWIEERPKIALTFDDGPHPKYTEMLLDGLKERGIKASFFVTGEHAQLYPDLIRRMQEEGHLIGNHTYSHIQLKNHNREIYKQELKETNQTISEITGETPLFVRPPYGTWDKAFEKELNMLPVLWTIDPHDWCTMDASCVTCRVLSDVEENDIILLHDNYETSVIAALQIADALTAEGYEFVTVDALFLE